MPSSSAELAAFAQRLRNLRHAFARAIDLPELAASEFARMLGVSVANYEAYERGDCEPPLSVLATLHRRTGVSLDWLVAAEHDQPVAGSLGERPAGGVRAGVR
jgi:transcriptional regulator with XRE-family HTH domain